MKYYLSKYRTRHDKILDFSSWYITYVNRFKNRDIYDCTIPNDIREQFNCEWEGSNLVFAHESDMSGFLLKYC